MRKIRPWGVSCVVVWYILVEYLTVFPLACMELLPKQYEICVFLKTNMFGLVSYARIGPLCNQRSNPRILSRVIVIINKVPLLAYCGLAVETWEPHASIRVVISNGLWLR